MRGSDSLTPVEQEILSDIMGDSYSLAEQWSVVLTMSPGMSDREGAVLFRNILRAFYAEGLIRLIRMDTETNERDMSPDEADAVMSDDATFEVVALRESHYIRFVATAAGRRLGSRPLA